MGNKHSSRNVNLMESKQKLSIISSLYNGSLITEDEKLRMEALKPNKMKARIFDLMFTKNSMAATKIFSKIIRAKNEYDEEENLKQNPIQNPMEMNTVLRKLFGYLDVEELKTCRLVCKKWNFEAEALLRKNSIIYFGISNNSTTAKILHPENFLETFHHFSGSASNQPFTSFRIYEELELRVSDFKNFIDKQKNSLQDLELLGSRLFSEDGNWVAEYDITDLFTEFSLSKLTIQGENYSDEKPASFLALSLSVLRSTKDVELFDCSITIESESAIAPISIKIGAVKFWKNGHLLEKYCLNDSVDFSKANCIEISNFDAYLDHNNNYTNPILDLSKLPNCVNHVYLYKTVIENWSDCKSEVKSLELRLVPFLQKTKMQIKELRFSGSSMDLFVLPLSLEKLHIGNPVNQTLISCSDPVTFPNLKLVVLENPKNFPNLEYFSNCSNLRDIKIHSKENDNFLLKLNWIPKSVTRMKLEGIEHIRIRGDDNLQLERLILENYSLADAAKIMMKITPNILALQWEREFETNGSVIPFLEKFKDLILYIGPFIWEDTNNVFETSPLIGLVDEKAEYYVFEDNQGRSLRHIKNKKSFMDFMDLNIV